VFAAAGDLSQQIVGLLVGTAVLAGQPLAFRARDFGSQDDLSNQLRSNAQLVFAVGLPSAAALVALSGPISHVYLGPRFHVDAGIIVAISAISMFCSGLRGNYFEQAFEVARRTRAIAVNTVVRVVLTIALSAWLIHGYAAVGAAVALLAAELVGLALSVGWSRRVMHVPIPVGSWLKISGATAAMVGAMAIVPGRSTFFGLAAALAVGAAVYCVAVALMHVGGVRAYLRAPRVETGAVKLGSQRA
jgi:O-antigen/teichoic acid export membrane protein